MEPVSPAPTHPPRAERFVRKYLLGIFILVALIVVSMVWGASFQATSMLHEQMLRQGRAFFAEVVVNRMWIANHGGVYVRMQPGDESNPWLLKVPGLKVVIHDESGEAYTLKNPALVTREISQIADRIGGFRFRITSETPINPANAPDPFERAALAAFSRGLREATTYEERDGKSFFRYMAPLMVEKPCLRCHGFQGYKEGDVRGGIGVMIDAAQLKRQVWIYRGYLGLSAAAIIALVYGIIAGVSRSFRREIRTAEAKLVEMATRDSLTGLLNRREMFRLAEREAVQTVRKNRPLSTLLLDIDRFKNVNDTRGHAVGDAVIQETARTIATTLRRYDIACRYGGEEFLVILPETDLRQAATGAERLRRVVESTPVAAPDQGEPVRISVSIGVAEMRPGEAVDGLIARADAAMYAAKQGGRNRVVPAE